MDSVRLADAVLERMNHEKLYAAYSRNGTIETSPKNLFKAIVFGSMNGVYASPKLEQPCRRDVNFMYLSRGRNRGRGHATIARFRSERLTGAIGDWPDRFIGLLADPGELPPENVFIDVTKQGDNAN